MNREFVAREVGKIIGDERFPLSRNMALASAWILGNIKGTDLKIFDLRTESDLCDYHVLGSARSTVQLKAMADEILFYFKRFGFFVQSKEGVLHSGWALLDLGDIIVHIFLEETRNIYALDELWSGAKTLDIPQNYYFSFDGVRSKNETA